MQHRKRISLSIAAAFATTIFCAVPGTQTALAQQPSVRTSTPATIWQVVSATTFEHANVFVVVCDSQSPACQESLQAFSLNASLVLGGWTAGAKNRHGSE